MGAFADSLFSLLLGWVRGLVGAIMTVISSGGESGILPFLGKNWLAIVVIIVAIGLAGDWFIWMVRWQPYRVWGTNMRRVARALHIGGREQEEAQQEPEDLPAQESEDTMAQTMLYQRPDAQAEENSDEVNIDFAPDAQDDFDLPPLTPEDEAQAYAAAADVQDEQLGDYPGMRYDMSAYMRPEEEPAAEAENAQAAYGEAGYDEGIPYEETAYDGEPPYEEPAYEESVYQEPAYDPTAEDAPVLHRVEEASAQEQQPWPPEPEEDAPQDVELAREIDPLAAYDDPQMLRRMAQEETATGRRRRRRAADSLASQDTRLYSAVHAGHSPQKENR